MPQSRADANRANARRSTGPRSAAGKARASKNALRHGLNAAPSQGADVPVDVLSLASRLSGRSEPGDAGLAAAEAQTHLVRIRTTKLRVLEASVRRIEAEAGPDQRLDPDAVLGRALAESAEELRVLDGYDRKAHSRRKTAFRRLWE
jgi:hypothetical protein